MTDHFRAAEEALNSPWIDEDGRPAQGLAAVAHALLALTEAVAIATAALSEEEYEDE